MIHLATPRHVLPHIPIWYHNKPIPPTVHSEVQEMNSIGDLAPPSFSSLDNNFPLRALRLQSPKLHTRAQLLSYICNNVQRRRTRTDADVDVLFGQSRESACSLVPVRDFFELCERGAHTSMVVY